MPGMMEGKVAVVTGAGGGIGREIALMMAAAGAKVIVADIGASLIVASEWIKRVREGIAMNDKYIDLSKELLEERMNYVKYREEAVRLSGSDIDSQLRAVTMERIKALDAAIAVEGSGRDWSALCEGDLSAIVNETATGFTSHPEPPRFAAVTARRN